jgi:hypothetical protein
MARRDLLSLSPDDLTALSNRGIVKRAQQEIEGAQLTCELVESAEGAVTAQWSDDVECVLGAADTLANAQCSCPATSLCRHIIRTVLAYQRQAAQQGTDVAAIADPEFEAPESGLKRDGDAAPDLPEDGGKSPDHGPASGNMEAAIESPTAGSTPSAETVRNGDPLAATAPTLPVPAQSEDGSGPRAPAQASASQHTDGNASWNPGEITDAVLDLYFPKKTLAMARKQFETGHVLELVCAAKPSARNHTLGFHLRFLVPGDPRYVYCDCSEPSPCSHVPLTVWAFRLLAPGSEAGLISTRTAAMPVPTALIGEVETCLEDLSFYGLANLPTVMLDRLRRLEARCREEGLVWPAEIIGELILQRDAYVRHDARYSSARLSELLAEACIRLDAIRADTGAVPQLFIRGSRADQPTEIGSARLIGLGCGVENLRTGVRLSSYLQDSASGMLVAVRRDYPNPPSGTEEAAPYWQLAQSPVFKGVSLASLGNGQMLVKGGKRSPNHEFHFGRAPVNVNPQSYQWEALRPPALAASFREVASRLTALPPPPLRPRRLAEDFHVCPVAGVSGARFDPVEQAVSAILQDPEGGTAILFHPFSTRGAPGAEALLAVLTDKASAASLRFVAGRTRLRGGELIVAPVSLVTEANGIRNLIQPWIERSSPSSSATSGPSDDIALPTANLTLDNEDPVDQFRDHIIEEAGELILTGLERAGEALIERWRENLQHGEALGFVHFVRPLARLIEALESKRHSVQWNSRPAYQALTEAACAALLMQTI